MTGPLLVFSMGKKLEYIFKIKIPWRLSIAESAPCRRLTYNHCVKLFG
jgi:hypothetical protein